MAKYSAKMMGKEVGDAGVYATPHTMAGAKVTVNNAIPLTTGAKLMDEMNMSVAGISKGNCPPINRHGEQTMRGYGAATKGIKTRGPMA
jgi:hypothetical protein